MASFGHIFSVIYLWAQILGPITSPPCGALYTCQIITFSKKASEVDMGVRPDNPEERIGGSQYWFWAQYKKTLFLPILLWLIFFGDGPLIAFGNAVGSGIFLYRLWKRGEDVKNLLMFSIVVATVSFSLFIYQCATYAPASVPLDLEGLNFIFHTHGLRNLVLLLLVLITLSIINFVARFVLDRKNYITAVISASGAGFSLNFLSDGPSLFFNSLSAGVKGVGHIWAPILSTVWSILLMLSFINITETTPFSVLIGILQPYVFALSSFFVSYYVYGTYGDVSLADMPTFWPCVGSFFLILAVDWTWHSLETTDPEQAKFRFLKDVWVELKNLRRAIARSAERNQNSDIENPTSSAPSVVVELTTIGATVPMSIAGSWLNSPPSSPISCLFHSGEE